MPLIERLIQPVELVQSSLHPDLKGNDELLSVNMNALVGILRQLSSLSKHAESLFADLFNEASRTIIKAKSLENRVLVLSDKLSHIQYTKTEAGINLNTYNTDHGRFDLGHVADQNVVTRENRSKCVKERHVKADIVPNLSIFNGTRDDGKDYGQLYTDPFFFNKTWIKQQEAEYEKMAKQRNHRSRRKKRNTVRKQPKPVTVKRYHYDHLGNKVVSEERVRKVETQLSEESPIPEQDEFTTPQPPHDANSSYPPLLPTDYMDDEALPAPPDLDNPPYPDVPPPPPDDSVIYEEPNHAPAYPAAPPVPPAPPCPAIPPAPAPPPPPVAPSQGHSAPVPAAAFDLSSVKLQSVPQEAATEKPQSLLQSIQNYSLTTLKKVEKPAEKPQEVHYASMDVMSIINRRLVMQVSDSDDDSESGSSYWSE